MTIKDRLQSMAKSTLSSSSKRTSIDQKEQEVEYRETRKQVSENEKNQEGSACSNRPRYAAAAGVPHHRLAFYIASATPLLSA